MPDSTPQHIPEQPHSPAQAAQPQPAPESSNRRIAKNTLALYVRMLIVLVVGLYTSRVVLATLGVSDYGIYGVVGGIVAMLGFLNASMSGATSRFLTFELGRGNQERLAKTFSSALIIHVFIALIVLVVAETVGLWFLLHKLVIPPGRMHAAMWVYQLSILSAMLGITQVPYNATIIAHERMGVYAWVEILNSVLKLLIVYLLQIGHFDKLILYAILTFAVSLIILLIYRVYCLRHFPESHFHWLWDKTYLKPLLSFSGWDLYGNMCVSVRQQGVNFLINMFFGVVYNAASAIATTVQGIILGLSQNILTAFRPQIIKLYASRQNNRSIELLYKAGKFAALLMLIVSVPLCIEIDYVLHIWLKTVPPYANTFCQLLLASGVLSVLNSTLNIGIHATGKIALLSFITGTLFLLTLPIVWVGFICGMSSSFAYASFVYVNIIVLLTNALILHHNNRLFSVRHFFTICFSPVAIVAIISVVLSFWLKEEVSITDLGHMFSLLLSISVTIVISIMIGLTNAERRYLVGFIKAKYAS